MTEAKTKILTEALAGRDAEVLSYQIDIDNFTLAIKRIDGQKFDGDEMGAAMVEFRERLASLRLSSQIEQAKAKIMRDVIADQLGVE
jgi:hypothetical protein